MNTRLIAFGAIVAHLFGWPMIPLGQARPQMPTTSSGQQEVRNVRNYGARCDGATDDRMAIQAAINATKAAGGGTVLIPSNSTCGVSGTIEMRNRVNVMGTNSAESKIKALRTFPENSPVIRFAASAQDYNITYSFLRNLSVDCSDITGCIGVYASSLNELSGLKQVLVDNYGKYGIWLSTSGCQNWTLEDLYLASSAKATASIGLYISRASSSNVVKRITVFSKSRVTQDAGIAEEYSDVVYEAVHIENHNDGLRFGANAKGVAMGVFGHATTPNLVHIESTTNSIALFDLQSGGSENTLKDDWDGVELAASSNPYIAMYVVGWAGGSAVLSTAKNGIRNYLPTLDVGSLSSIQTRHAINSVAFSAMPVFDLALGDQDLVLEGNVTSSSVTNLAPGQRTVFRICQNRMGGFEFTWPPNTRGGMVIGKQPGRCSVQTFQTFDGRTIQAIAPGVTDE